jgi:hypothetical protein
MIWTGLWLVLQPTLNDVFGRVDKALAPHPPAACLVDALRLSTLHSSIQPGCSTRFRAKKAPVGIGSKKEFVFKALF